MKKKQKIELRLTSLEKDIIKKRAENSGLSVSAFLRHAAFSQKVTSKMTDEEFNIFNEMLKFNLNFERISNMYKSKNPEINKEVRELIKEFGTHLKRITKA